MEKTKEQLETENLHYRRTLECIQNLINSKRLPEGFINGYLLGAIDANITLVLEDPYLMECKLTDDSVLRALKKYEGKSCEFYNQIALNLELGV